MTAFAWGVIGPGRIARKFASAVAGMDGSEFRAVHGRDPVRATEFAFACAESAGSPPPRIYTNGDDLLGDPGIDAVYVATPHAHHAEWVRRCLEAGKPVLCEKPLVPNAAQGQALVDLASERQVFLMEAMWTRFLPAYAIAGEWLRAGAIGELRAIQSSFCFPAPFDARSRLFDPALAGGALLDVGIYNLSVTRWVLQAMWGTCPEPLSIHAAGVLAPTGVDQRVATTLVFERGTVSQFVCGLDGCAPNALTIHGEHGVIELPARFWEATAARLQRSGEPELLVQAPFLVNGFEYEIAEAQRCISAGLIESPTMPHQETLATLRWMDEIRRQIGVRYPFE